MTAPLRYLSVCSGIEAATQAWSPLGWRPVAFSEIEPFPSAVLAHHYPAVPNWGDMTRFEDWPDAAVDVLCGGTPCQDFSVAGLGAGLDGARGGLMLTFGAIARRYRPRWLVWENVPGVLSNDRGRAFAGLLGLLSGRRVEVPAGGWQSAGVVEGVPGAYGLAWRVLDAQHVRTRRFPFALPQRRRRVWVVGYLGDWRRAGAVLFDRESLSGHPPPRRRSGQAAAGALDAGLGVRGAPQGERGHLIAAEVAASLDASFGRLQGASGQDANHGHSHLLAFGGNNTSGPIEVATALNAHGGGTRRLDFESETFIAFDCLAGGETGMSVGDVPGALHGGGRHGGRAAVAFDLRGREGGAMPEGLHDTANLRAASGGSSRSYVAEPLAVRRLTPRECERLQGFPDDFTRIPWGARKRVEASELLYIRLTNPALSMEEARRLAADGPRYKALGNSWAVNCAEWLGERIAMVEEFR